MNIRFHDSSDFPQALPAGPSARESVTFCHDRLADTPRLTAKPLVLVNEPVLSNRYFFISVLKRAGMLPVGVDHEEKALAKLHTCDFDLIVLDVQYPPEKCIEQVRRIKATPGLSAIPILAVSACAMKGDRRRILDGGYDAYLSKPVRMNDFIRAVRELIAVTR
ncbi:response regulator [Desulfohalovibrio reitneri]|uniref:response regulator n=1 Tax=Desulfohalovibrio reitneri TaxID=1307759 RepID=UPI000691F759|nr:response regulator [Desulfohalovibrio reitneri]